MEHFTELFPGEAGHRLFLIDAHDDEQEIAMRSPLAFATSFRSPARLYYGSQEHWASAMTQGTARAAKAKGLDVVAERVSGDHFTSVPRGIARSITFFASFHPVGDEPKPIRVEPGSIPTI